MQDQAAQHSPGRGAGPVVETAIQNHAAADSGAVGDTEIVPYTLGGAIGPLSERRRADIVEDDGGDMEPRLKESLYIHAGIARQVFIGVSDDPGTWVHLSGRADADEVKGQQWAQQSCSTFQDSGGTALAGQGIPFDRLSGDLPLKKAGLDFCAANV